MTTPETQPLRIVEFRAENFKRLSVVEIRPDSDVVEITGRNGNGKSSVLDAILAAFGGGRALPMKPIREGCERAVIKLDLGELRIERRFKLKEEGGYSTEVFVESAEGARFKSPQDILNALVGDFTFDPLSFTRLSSADQFEALKAFVPGIDFAADEKADKKDFEARTDINRRVKDLRAQAGAISLPPGALPTRVDVEALEKQLGEAADNAADIERKRAARTAAEQRLEQIAVQLRELEAERASLQARLDAAAPLPEVIDTAALREKLAAGRAANEVLERAANRRRLTEEADAKQLEAEALTKAMDDRERARRKAVAAAKMPVEGLGFGVGHVTLNGQPFSQASDAEQLRASIGIAAAMNPRLRIARVRDGSLLDDLAMAELKRFAAEANLQIWIERVDSSGTVGFVLEDGHLKGEAPPQGDANAEEAI